MSGNVYAAGRAGWHGAMCRWVCVGPVNVCGQGAAACEACLMVYGVVVAWVAVAARGSVGSLRMVCSARVAGVAVWRGVCRCGR